MLFISIVGVLSICFSVPLHSLLFRWQRSKLSCQRYQRQQTLRHDSTGVRIQSFNLTTFVPFLYSYIQIYSLATH
ncbi:hypothetical protein GGR57DRAFT_115874 [Xylariaceae sp. FL1272]|nr:hypothetical protein GGR57DRAFT_115874 [Xylariaceae sp. FL1272]